MPTGFLLGITENPGEFRIDLQNAVTCVEPNNGFWHPAGQHDPHQRVWLLLFVTESAIRCPNRRHLARLFQSLAKTRDAMSSSSKAPRPGVPTICPAVFWDPGSNISATNGVL